MRAVQQWNPTAGGHFVQAQPLLNRARKQAEMSLRDIGSQKNSGAWLSSQSEKAAPSQPADPESGAWGGISPASRNFPSRADGSGQLSRLTHWPLSAATRKPM